MKNKLTSFANYYKAHPKRFWVLGIIIVLALIFTLTGKSDSSVTIVAVEATDLRQTVLATGQVTSQTDLALSFSSSGLVDTLSATVGRKVFKGQVLATLENGNEYAALKSAQARYQKVAEGASTEEVRVAETSLASAKTSLANTKKVQDTLVENAHRALLNADTTPVLSNGKIGTKPTVTGTYIGVVEGVYDITFSLTGTGANFHYSGIESGSGEVSTTNPSALGTKGLFIQFASDYSSNSINTWSVLLPNTNSANYLSVYNAYQNALKNRDSAIASALDLVAEREASLDLKKAVARPADLSVAQADVLSAQATYEKTVLRAPANGTVVRVDTKIGERVDTQKSVVVIQDVGALYVEADINEANIAKVAVGQPVVMTLDAFGPETKFTGAVVHVDPSSTTIDGIANYRIKVSIKDESGLRTIRPGMNVNMIITAWEKPGVIAVPKAAVTTETGGISTVNIVTSEKKSKTEVRTVTLGAVGDGNLVEVISGLSVGEKIGITK